MLLQQTFYERQNNLREPLAILYQLSIYLPFFLIAAMGLMYAGVLKTPVFNETAYFLISAAFLLIVIMRLFVKKPSFGSQIFFIAAYNLLGACSLLLVTGVNSPFAIFWLVLLLSGYANFARTGYFASMAVLFVTSLLYVCIVPLAAPAFYFTVLFYFCFISILGYILAELLHLTNNSQAALAYTKSEEATQRDRLNTLLNSIAEAVLTTDPQGTVTLQNAAVLALFDTNKSVVGQNINDILRLTDEENTAITPTSLLKKTRAPQFRTDLTHHFTKADTIRLSIQITPIRTSFKGFSEPGYVFIMRDITKEKSLEDERDEFISVVSHELRTPVTIAEGSLSNLLLLQERDGNGSSVVSSTAKTAHEQVLYLAKMVNDLSTLSRAERGIGDAVEPIDLHELLVTLFQKYEPEAHAKGLHMNLDAPLHLPRITTSRLYLEEILQNFITNAIKYTQKGSITLHGHKTASGIRFSVSDTGIGISKSDQAKIFQKFYRAEDYRIRETSGTGLGLYVVKKLATKLGVKVELQSRLNHGSEFSFLLPIKKR